MKDKDCPHCNLDSQAYRHHLGKTENFYIVADAHPLMEGHILIIPKEHISCVGEYPSVLLEEFEAVYKKVCIFIKDEYGSVSTFEHGKLGQTVFHSHVHILPFKGKPEDIMPEGNDKTETISAISELTKVFESKGQYLFFSIENQMWLVDTDLGFPRFFRDKFAQAVGRQERGNWKQMHEDANLMSVADAENERLRVKWKNYFEGRSF
jgi:diadenosine tetraphosphate (Ap4A) HIT family hydrolase